MLNKSSLRMVLLFFFLISASLLQGCSLMEGKSRDINNDLNLSEDTLSSTYNEAYVCNFTVTQIDKIYSIPENEFIKEAYKIYDIGSYYPLVENLEMKEILKDIVDYNMGLNRNNIPIEDINYKFLDFNIYYDLNNKLKVVLNICSNIYKTDSK
jgi:hypothetical protein